MRKIYFMSLCMLFCIVCIQTVEAKRGCCSHHGGVAYCGSIGRYVCNDGSYSPTCTCTPPYIYGCTDPSAKNYNSSANKDNGSCTYYVYGCTNPDSINYNISAEKDDGSCVAKVYGCTDVNAYNYNSSANTDDGSCVAKVYGCTDKKAINYNNRANVNNNSCKYEEQASGEIQMFNEVSKELMPEENDSAIGVIVVASTAAGVYYIRKRKNK